MAELLALGRANIPAGHPHQQGMEAARTAFPAVAQPLQNGAVETEHANGRRLGKKQ